MTRIRRSALKAVLDELRCWRLRRPSTTGFASWAEAAGFTYANRRGVAVALDEPGRVVAAMDLSSTPGPSTRGVTVRAERGRRVHTHGFAVEVRRMDLVQDYYAIGIKPERECGETWQEGGDQ